MSCGSYEHLLLALRGCAQPPHCFPCISHSAPWIHAPCKTSNKPHRQKCYYPMKRFKHYWHRPSFTASKKQQFTRQHGSRKGGGAPNEQHQATASSCSGAPEADSSLSTCSAQAVDSASSTALVHHNLLCLKKNKALRKKITRLQRQVAELEQHGNLADLEKLESLAKDHKEVLLRFIKLEKEKKALEKVVESLRSKDEHSPPPPAAVAVAQRTVHVQTCRDQGLALQSLRQSQHNEHHHQHRREAGEDKHAVHRSTTYVNNTGVQCTLLTWETRRASWEQEREEAEQRILERHHASITELKQLYGEVIEKYSDRFKELVACHEAKEASLEAQIHDLNSELEKVREELAEAGDNRDVAEERKASEDADHNPAPTALTVEHLSGLLHEWKLAANSRDAGVDSLRQSIEDSLNKMHEALQQQTSAIAELKVLKQTCESLKEENFNLRLKFENETTTKAKFQEKLLKAESRLSEIETERRLHRTKEEELAAERDREAASLRRARDQLSAALDSTRAELSAVTAELGALSSSRLKLECELREQKSVVAALKEQLEERITENCSLNTRLEERSAQLKKTAASLSEVREKCSADHSTKLLELKESIRLLTAVKENMTQSHESEVRQLRNEIDQMRVRNETFQRQLAAITSTYNHMFGATDGSDNNSP